LVWDVKRNRGRIATEEEDLAARVNQITSGRGARIVFGPIGGKVLEGRQQPQPAAASFSNTERPGRGAHTISAIHRSPVSDPPPWRGPSITSLTILPPATFTRGSTRLSRSPKIVEAHRYMERRRGAEKHAEKIVQDSLLSVLRARI
jgi:hypothetical protein